MQTEFDNQSRALNDAQAQLERSQLAVQEHDARYQELDRELRRQRSILEELQADPAMQDARRLADLEQQEKSGERAAQAMRHALEARARCASEVRACIVASPASHAGDPRLQQFLQTSAARPCVWHGAPACAQGLAT